MRGRFTIVVSVAALALVALAGCGSSSRSVLDEGVHFGMLGRLHRIGPAEALRSVRDAHRSWLAELRTAANQNPTRRFPSPSRAVMKQRLERAAHRFGFRVESVRMRRPDQLAPDIVIESTHYVELAKAIPRIDTVDPPPASNDRAYEGIFLAAVDDHGIPFVIVADSLRNQATGEQWARADRLYPYEHL